MFGTGVSREGRGGGNSATLGRERPNLPDQPVAALSGHREVAQEHVRALPLQRGERLLGGTDRGDLGAILREDVSHDLSHVARVVDDQHPDTIKARAIIEPRCGSRHVSPLDVLLKAGRLYPRRHAKTGQYCSRGRHAKTGQYCSRGFLRGVKVAERDCRTDLSAADAVTWRRPPRASLVIPELEAFDVQLNGSRPARVVPVTTNWAIVMSFSQASHFCPSAGRLCTCEIRS